MLKTLLSIVIPSYNQSNYVSYNLNSIRIAKSIYSIEVIVLDSCSSDGTKEILLRNSDIIDHLRISKDNGQAEALRDGFNLAKGEILCWLNTDDILLPQNLKHVFNEYDKFKRKDEFSLCGAAIIIDDKNRFIKDRFGGLYIVQPTPMNKLMTCFGEMGFIQSSWFFSKSLYLRTNGINPNMQFCMDLSLELDFLNLTSISSLNMPISAFRSHNNSKTKLLKHVCAEERALLQSKLFGKIKKSIILPLLIQVYVDSIVRILRLVLRYFYYPSNSEISTIAEFLEDL